MNEFKNENRDAAEGDCRSQITDHKDGVCGPTGHRRNGKIARLPRAARETINELLDDGVGYDAIIKELGEDGKGLNTQNICNWVQGGYRDWIKERERAALLEGNFSRVVDLLMKAEPDEVPDLVVKLFAARVGGVLSDLSPSELRENSEKDPRNLVRLLSLVPKLSREALRTRKYRRCVQREEAAELKERERPFGDENDHRAVVDIVDKVLGLGRHTKRRARRTSNIQLPTSNVQRIEEDSGNGKWNMENGKGSERDTGTQTSGDERRTSNIQLPTSNVQRADEDNRQSTIEDRKVADVEEGNGNGKWKMEYGKTSEAEANGGNGKTSEGEGDRLSTIANRKDSEAEAEGNRQSNIENRKDEDKNAS